MSQNTDKPYKRKAKEATDARTNGNNHLKRMTREVPQQPQSDKEQPLISAIQPHTQEELDTNDWTPLPERRKLQLDKDKNAVFELMDKYGPYFNNMSDLMFFTKNAGAIADLLNNFRDLKIFKIPSEVNYIGANSINGFVTKLTLTYEDSKYKYNFDVLLKSVKERPGKKYPSDNLGYEYFVGAQCVNEFARMYPMFIKTYGFFSYKDQAAYEVFASGSKTKTVDLKKKLYSDYIQWIDVDRMLLSEYVETARNTPAHLIVMSEYIPVEIDLKTFMLKEFDADKEEVISDKAKLLRFYASWIKLIGILYMVYLPLNNLSNNFTHYDLHAGNVLLYSKKSNPTSTPVYNEKIKVNITSLKGNQGCSFITDTIPVIIDYGRSYISCKNVVDTSNPPYSSTEYGRELCKVDESPEHTDCGRSSGHTAIIPEPFDSEKERKTSWIISNKRNHSYDLRLLNMVTKPYDTQVAFPKNHPLFYEMQETINQANIKFWEPLEKIKFAGNLHKMWIKIIGDIVYSHPSGTPEYNEPGKITTVNQASDRLEEIIRDPVYQKASAFLNKNPTFKLDMYKDGYKPFDFSTI